MRIVLIVDNSEIARSHLVQPLREAGFETIEAENAQDALAILVSKQVSLLITDLYMPGMDGLELAEFIQAAAHPSKPPIMVISSESSPKIKARAKLAGVKAWIIKPANLMAVVETAKILTEDSTSGFQSG